VEPHEYDDLLRRLTALVVKLDERDEHILTLIDEQREFNRQQVALNEQQRAINADVRTTLALIARMLPTGENGREA
jgi:hypothetical protein